MTIQKFDPRARKVKILATIGPASRDPDMLRRLFKAGADAFRVNMSHGEHSVHGETIRAIRALEKEFARPIAILADLQGPKLRVGLIEQPSIGSSKQCERNTAKPIAMHAFWPTVDAFDTAVSHTV